MLLIEFCGPGGCGKTTVCDGLEADLAKHGIQVKNLQKRKRVVSYRDRINKAFLMLRYCVYPANITIGLLLLKFALLNHFKGYFKWTLRMIELNYVISKEKDADIILLDEGFVQFISSLAFDQDIKENCKSICSYLDNQVYDVFANSAILVKCDTNQDEIIRRLKFRNRKNDRNIDSSSERMIALINIRRNNIDRIVGLLNKPKVVNCDSGGCEIAIGKLVGFIFENDVEE